jgi:hypothetical protein
LGGAHAKKNIAPRSSTSRPFSLWKVYPVLAPLAPKKEGIPHVPPGLIIRKFRSRHFTADEPVRIGTLTATELDLIHGAMEARRNVSVSRGTGTGKSTCQMRPPFLPADDRMGAVSDRHAADAETLLAAAPATVSTVCTPGRVLPDNGRSSRRTSVA